MLIASSIDIVKISGILSLIPAYTITNGAYLSNDTNSIKNRYNISIKQQDHSFSTTEKNSNHIKHRKGISTLEVAISLASGQIHFG